MATAVAVATARPRPIDRLTAPRELILLVLLMWMPLTLYVMFGACSASARDYVLLPAIPATLLLYVIAIARLARILDRRDRHHARHVLAADGGHRPLPAADRSQQADRAVRPPSPRRSDFFWLGTDFKGRDMLSRD